MLALALLLATCRSARKSITFIQYVYEKGAISQRIAEALAERCRAGVGVNVLLDYTGSLKFPAEYGKLLTTTYESWKRRGLKARLYELIALPMKNQL